VGVGVQTAGDDRRERAGEMNVVVLASILERMASRQHLAEDDAPCVDVGASIDALAEQLLGCHVRGCAEHRSRTRQSRGFGTFDLRDPEVDDFHAAVRFDQDVLRLQVAMDHTGLVRRCERIGDRQGDCARAFGRDRPSRDLLAQRFTADVLGGDEQVIAHLLERIDDGDRRV